MNIAIIGAGNVGAALAGAATRAGHTVAISDQKREGAQAVAQKTGARAAESNAAAVQGAEIIIPALYYSAIEGVLGELGAAIDGRVLIDVSNRFGPDDPGAVIDGSSNAEQIQARAPAARVVKAFNTVFASRQADPTVDGVQLDGFVAGDDAEAKARVMELVQSIGLRPIDAGPLSMARALEAMAGLNMWLNHRNGWPWQSGWKLLGPTGAT
jgi:predicted dinucleotide-binding enzyme